MGFSYFIVFSEKQQPIPSLYSFFFHLITLLVEGKRLFKMLYSLKTDQAICLCYYTLVSTGYQNGPLLGTGVCI